MEGKNNECWAVEALCCGNKEEGWWMEWSLMHHVVRLFPPKMWREAARDWRRLWQARTVHSVRARGVGRGTSCQETRRSSHDHSIYPPSVCKTVKQFADCRHSTANPVSYFQGWVESSSQSSSPAGSLLQTLPGPVLSLAPDTAERQPQKYVTRKSKVFTNFITKCFLYNAHLGTR